jgi:hypothetical protein
MGLDAEEDPDLFWSLKQWRLSDLKQVITHWQKDLENRA